MKKNSILFLFFIICSSLIPPPQQQPVNKSSASENLFIIITDGFRWQEVFQGADSVLINDERFTPDTATIKAMYWNDNMDERRKKLMPFFWNVLVKKGQLFGNRELDNKVDAANLYAVSYPGYNEIFTGTTDIFISGNSKKKNPNINVLEFLDKQEEFSGKIAVFSSWDVFPYILNRERNNLQINSGYQQLENKEQTVVNSMINSVQENGIENKSATRHDMLTFAVAREYIKNHLPRVVVVGFGETDDFAHAKRYDLYLQQANQFDRMLAELWHMVQITPAYKDKTSFLITTDHGRGKTAKHWSGHGPFINGSAQTWLALMGPNIKPEGEINASLQIYNRQFAETIANLLNQDFKTRTPLSYSK